MNATILLLITVAAYAGIVMWFMRTLKRRGRRSPINENLLREPGHSLRLQKNELMVDGLGLLMMAAVAPGLFYSLYLEQIGNAWFTAAAGLVITFTCVVLSTRKFRKAILLHQAIEAEVATGQGLTELMRDGAWVFHDISYPYGNIDHVVIGSGGVFAVETKGYSKTTNSQPGTGDGWVVTVNNGVLEFPGGRTGEPLKQAKRHAKWLRDEIQRRFKLEVYVRPIVALPGWLIKEGFSDECWVINPKRGNALRKAITKVVLTEQEVAMIASWVEDLCRTVAPKSREFDSK